MIYADINFFQQRACPVYNSAIMEINDKEYSFLPTKGVYRFRYFESLYDLKELSSFLKNMKLEELYIAKYLLSLEKFNYIGRVLTGKELEDFKRMLVNEKINKNDLIIDPDIYGLSPMIVSKSKINNIYEPLPIEKQKSIYKKRSYAFYK